MNEVQEKGLQRQVFVSARAGTGTGTATDPYNATGPDKFAEVMRSIPPYSEVVLLPGAHDTWGFNFDPELAQKSFLLKPGWKFRGCGKGNTTLRLAALPEAKDNRRIMLTNTAGGSFDNSIEVSDLTFDLD